MWRLGKCEVENIHFRSRSVEPIIWDDLVFVTSTISNSEPDLRVSLFVISGGLATHILRLYCLATETVRMMWERTVHGGLPSVKRISESNPC